MAPAANSSGGRFPQGRTRIGDRAVTVPIIYIMRRLVVILLLLVWAAAAGPPGAHAVLQLEPPVPGAVLRAFDGGTSPYSAGHRGVDLAAGQGEAVRAGADGVVSFSGAVAGRPSVSVRHADGRRTTHTPVLGILPVGQQVLRGEVIGHVGGDFHCGARPCLHWGLTDGRNYWDPTSAASIGVIRLLPRGTRPPAEIFRLDGELPVAGRITSRFGMRVHPVTGVRKLHDGTDIAASCGTPIHLPWAGVVTGAAYHPAYGFRVTVDHGDRRTAYTHLPGLDVRVGQRLQAGQLLGRVGTTGLSTGCHLHWMAWERGRLVDPLSLVAGHR